MNCVLKGEIDHSNVRKGFELDLLCPLMKSEKSLGVVCGMCCFRFSQLMEAVRDLFYRRAFLYEGYQHNPDSILEHLEEPFLEYYKALRARGLTIEDIQRECPRCTAGINQPIIGKTPTRIKV